MTHDIVIPNTITKVILIVFIFAFGITPRELEALKLCVLVFDVLVIRTVRDPEM